MQANIDERLSTNSALLSEGPLSSIFLKNNAAYPWIVLVPRVDNISEIYELSAEQQVLLMQEISKASKILKTSKNKINIAALGNIVKQLHVHIVARQENDAAWPHSIWQENMPQESYPEEEWQQLVNDLTTLLCS